MKHKLKGDDFNSGFKKHTFCLFPEYEISSPVPDESMIFKSAMEPLKMSWLASRSTAEESEEDEQSDKENESKNSSQ